jgi:hypothetical protein
MIPLTTGGQTLYPKDQILGCKCFAGLESGQRNILLSIFNNQKRVTWITNAITHHQMVVLAIADKLSNI